MSNSNSRWIPGFLILSVSFFLAGFLPFSILNLTHLAESWKERVQIRVFLSDQASDEEAQRFQSQWERWEEIAEVRWTSRDQVLERLIADRSWQREKNAVLTLVDALGENPLPHTLTLLPAPGFRTTEGVQKISQRLHSVSEVSEVLYDSPGIQNLDLLSGLVKTAAIWGGVVLVLSLFFLVTSVMAASAVPVVWGCLIGAGGAALSLLLSVLFYSVLSSKVPLEGLTGLSGVQWTFFPWTWMGIWVAGGGLSGAVGAWFASLVRK